MNEVQVNITSVKPAKRQEFEHKIMLHFSTVLQGMFHFNIG